MSLKTTIKKNTLQGKKERNLLGVLVGLGSVSKRATTGKRGCAKARL